jgi:hypothetical protein
LQGLEDQDRVTVRAGLRLWNPEEFDLLVFKAWP